MSQSPSAPNYMDNVMSRFGHHLSPNQRTHLSDSMVSNLQSAKPGPGPSNLPVYHIAPHSTISMTEKSSNANSGSGGVTPMYDVEGAAAK
jgi:hypothetical protein